MLERYFFILGLVNSILLIAIFIMRKRQFAIIQRFGWIYLLLAIPAVYGVILTSQESKSVQYSIFLGIFLTFLFMEWLLDYTLKIDFRAKMKANWKWTVPYLMLYYAMNYGFIVMPWRTSRPWV